MSSSSPLVTPKQLATFRTAAIAAIIGSLATAVVGLGFKSEAIGDLDARIFNSLVPRLQSSDLLIDLANAITPVATISVGRIGGVAIGIVAAVYHRQFFWVVLAPMTMIGAQLFQNLIIEIVKRPNPTELVIGNSGGFFSGGVMRAIVLTAMLLTALRPRLAPGVQYGFAGAVGVVVAGSRMVLGRHWLLDVLAAFPVGLGIAWLFRLIAYSWLDQGETTADPA